MKVQLSGCIFTTAEVIATGLTACQSSGIDVKIFASYSANYPFAVLAGKNSGIKSVKELKGKKVAVGFGTTPYMFLSRQLSNNGLSIHDVEVVNTAADGPAMIASGQVDAVVTRALNRAYEYAKASPDSALGHLIYSSQ